MGAAETLRRLLGALSADPTARAVGIGGSFARGTADEVSDLDLWIEGEDWRPESLGGMLLAGHRRTMGGHPFLHGVTVDGTILDLVHGPSLPYGYVRLDLPAPEPLDPAPWPDSGLVSEF